MRISFLAQEPEGIMRTLWSTVQNKGIWVFTPGEAGLRNSFTKGVVDAKIFSGSRKKVLEERLTALLIKTYR